MKIQKDKSLKPFGSGTSCIDCVDGDCIRNISLEECIDNAKKSNQSQAGIYVNVKDSILPSYCLPLNTDNWGNLALSPSYISTNNDTILSTKNNVETTFFYNDKKYALPSFDDLEKFIFDYDIIQLKYKDDNGEMLTMNENFKFVKDTAFSMLFRNYWNIQYGKINRCASNGKYNFFRGRESFVLSTEKPYNHFEFINFSLDYFNDLYNQFFVQAIDSDELFINSLQPVSIYHQNTLDQEKQYLYVEPTTNILSFDNKGSNKKSIFYLYKSFDLDNAYPIEHYFQLPKNLEENMSIYLDDFVRQTNLKKETVPQTQPIVVNDYNYPWLWTSITVLILVLFLNITFYARTFFKKKK